jgi:hypothetical protein
MRWLSAESRAPWPLTVVVENQAREVVFTDLGRCYSHPVPGNHLDAQYSHLQSHSWTVFAHLFSAAAPSRKATEREQSAGAFHV